MSLACYADKILKAVLSPPARSAQTHESLQRMSLKSNRKTKVERGEQNVRENENVCMAGGELLSLLNQFSHTPELWVPLLNPERFCYPSKNKC